MKERIRMTQKEFIQKIQKGQTEFFDIDVSGEDKAIHLENIGVKHTLSLVGCQIDGSLVLTGAKIGYCLEIKETEIEGAILLDYAEIEDKEHGHVCIQDTNVKGSIDCRKSDFKSLLIIANVNSAFELDLTDTSVEEIILHNFKWGGNFSLMARNTKSIRCSQEIAQEVHWAAPNIPLIVSKETNQYWEKK